MGVFVAIVAGSGWLVALAVIYWHRWTTRQLRERIEWYYNFASSLEDHRNSLKREIARLRQP